MFRIPALIVTAALILSSCGGGTPGPGPQGHQGLQGPAGAAGPKGDPGAAGALYSNWLKTSDLPNNEISGVGSPASPEFNCLLRVRFTENTLSKYVNNAQILFFSRFEKTVKPIPQQDWETSSSMSYANGKFELRFSTGSEAGPPACSKQSLQVINPGLEVRYVVIPGAQLITPQSLDSNSSLKNLSYAEIQQRFGIKD